MSKLNEKSETEGAPNRNPRGTNIVVLAGSLTSSFLKDRAFDYVDSSEILLSNCNQKSVDPKSFAGKLRVFGKKSRQFDLAIAMSCASGALSLSEKSKIDNICATVEARLDHNGARRGNGLVLFTVGDRVLKARTKSTLGQGLTRLFAKVTSLSVKKDKASSDVSAVITSVKWQEDLATAKQLVTSGNLSDAKSLFEKVLKCDAQNVEALGWMGKISARSGDYRAAVLYFKDLSRLYPNEVGVLCDLGNALSETSEHLSAIATYMEAVRLAPKNVEAIMGLGYAYLAHGDDTKAIKILTNALDIAPHSPDVLVRLGYCYHIHDQIDKATLYYAKAIKLAPQHTYGLSNFGSLLSQRQKHEEAIQLFDRALASEPDNIATLFNKAMALLSLGRYSEGWPLHEESLTKSKLLRDAALVSGRPVWSGAIERGARLVIIAEQGLGDVLQFIRYAALCKDRVGKVFVVCRAPLTRLLKNCPFIDGAFTELSAVKFDQQVLIMSLPHIFGTTLATVPNSVPYLCVPEKAKKVWSTKISGDRSTLKVGLVWSGSLFAGRVRGDALATRRNLDLGQLKPLLDLEDVSFVSLQHGDEMKEIEALGFQERVSNPMKDITDFQDTAAMIENLDLVISVDTSVAHLAGGLGKPVWVLSRYDADWRWLNNRSDSPWYPTARVFGQPRPGDWSTVISDVCEALKSLSRSRAVNA